MLMIKDGFVLRKMPGMNVVMPIGNNVKEFKGALMLNDTGAFIFERLQEDKDIDTITKELTDTYDVSLDKAKTDVLKTITLLKEAGVSID